MIILRILSGLIGIISGLSAVVAVYLVYFSKTVNPSTGHLVDGFGRELSLTPTIIRFVLGTDSLWVGPMWSVIYWVVIVGLIGIAFLSLSWVFGSEK